MGTRLEFGPYFLTYRIKSVFCLRAFEDSYSASLCDWERVRFIASAIIFIRNSRRCDQNCAIHQCPYAYTDLPIFLSKEGVETWSVTSLMIHLPPKAGSSDSEITKALGTRLFRRPSIVIYTGCKWHRNKNFEIKLHSMSSIKLLK